MSIVSEFAKLCFSGKFKYFFCKVRAVVVLYPLGGSLLEDSDRAIRIHGMISSVPSCKFTGIQVLKSWTGRKGGLFENFLGETVFCNSYRWIEFGAERKEAKGNNYPPLR